MILIQIRNHKILIYQMLKKIITLIMKKQLKIQKKLVYKNKILLNLLTPILLKITHLINQTKRIQLTHVKVSEILLMEVK